MHIAIPLSACAAVAALSCSTLAGVVNPWDFNVFSRGDIGAPGSNYGSDFQGAAGAVGSAWFGSFSLRDVAGSSPSLANAWYGGGAFNNLQGGTVHGNIESAGPVTLNSHTVTGTVYSGGGLAGSGGTIGNGAVLFGSNTSSITVAGGVTTGVPFSPTVDVNAVSAFFLAQSNAAAALSNTATATPVFNAFTVNTVPGVNVVTVSALDLFNAHTFNVNGPGTLIINVTGSSATLDSTTWNYTGGASSRTTLLNYNHATTLNIPFGGNIVNILAPNAATTFLSGHVDGNLIVGSLMGGHNFGGQVNWVGGFSGTIPAPGAAAALALGGLAACRRRR
ncbi:MAG TPA: collagen-binding domain-containing protein [Phycisphaerales bacterium]|nr:collagen-binding domain-containing protein [Phycisphaerales bacterium]